MEKELKEKNEANEEKKVKKGMAIIIAVISALVVCAIITLVIINANRDVVKDGGEGLNYTVTEESNSPIATAVSNNLEDDKVSTAPDSSKVIDYKKILGKWYCMESHGYASLMYFEDKVTSYRDLVYADGLDVSLEEHEIYKEGAMQHTYTFDPKTKKGKCTSDMEELVFEYRDNKEIECLVLLGENSNSECKFYRTEAIAKKYDISYKETIEYLRKVQDKDGWVIEEGVLLAYLGNKTNVTIPKNVHTIDCFNVLDESQSEKHYNKITIPGNVKVISAGAFVECSVDKVVIKEGVESIGSNCFGDCYLDKIYFPRSVKTIGDMIMETEEGIECKIYCKKNSVADKHFKEYEPHGIVKIKHY